MTKKFKIVQISDLPKKHECLVYCLDRVAGDTLLNVHAECMCHNLQTFKYVIGVASGIYKQHAPMINENL
jgi:hypothetical protein